MLPSLILIAVLAGGSSGTTRPGVQRQRSVVMGVERTVGTVSAQASFVMTFSGQVVSLNWTQTTPGIDGLGGNVFRVAVTVDGISSCTLDVACDAPRGDYVATCAESVFSVGQDVDVRVTSNPCLTPPAGFPAFDILQ